LFSVYLFSVDHGRARIRSNSIPRCATSAFQISSRPRFRSTLAEDLGPRRAARQREDGICRPLARVASQLLVDRGESLHELIAIRTLELLEHGGPQHVRPDLLVEELRDNLTPREQVRLREVRSLEEFQSLEQETCERA